MIYVLLFSTETFFEARPDDLTHRTLLVIKCFRASYQNTCMYACQDPENPRRRLYKIFKSVENTSPKLSLLPMILIRKNPN